MRNETSVRQSTPTIGFVLFMLFAAATSLWIRSGFPVRVIGNSPQDDFLFVRLAHHLSLGDWLGPYNQLTLAKGMFYSVFLTVVHFARVPLKIAEQIVYLAASGLTAELVRRRTGNVYFGGSLFLLLAFNPVVWNPELARVIREGLYLSLSLAVIVLFATVWFPSQQRKPFASPCAVISGFGLGLIAAAYWLTREEGVWLVPSMGIIALIGTARIVGLGTSQKNEQAQSRSTRAKAVAVPLVLAALTCLGVDAFVAGLNYRHYGIFETNELRSRSFLRAYGALTRIRPPHWQQYVPFPADARDQAYSVSPAALELKPWLEGPYSAGWRRVGCEAIPVEPCREVLAGWFVWELRDAVVLAGHYGTAAEAMKFYETLARQIDMACSNHKIECLPQRDTLAPPFRAEYLKQFIHESLASAKIMLSLKDVPVRALPSIGPPDRISMFSQMVRGLSSPKELHIKGWAGATLGEPTLRVVSPDSEQYFSSTTILPSDDEIVPGASLKAVRFDVETNCVPLSCYLLVDSPGTQPFEIQLQEIVAKRSFSSPSMTLVIDDISFIEPKLTTAEAPSPQLKVASLIASFYAILMPVLAVLGTLGLVLAIAFKRVAVIETEILALVLASAAAIITRMALLAYIATTSFPAANLLYSSPASAFVIIFAVGGVYCGWAVLRHANSAEA